MTSLRDRIEAVREVADTLMDTGAILRLSVQAMSDACERGVAVAFKRDKGTFTIMAEGEFITSGGRAMSHPGWIVDIDHVPAWQRDRWVEPMQAGIHGPSYFNRSHPVMQAFGGRAPEYGRAMICADGRLVAWAGVFVDSRRPLGDAERAQLAAIWARLAEPLRISALLARGELAQTLSSRQKEILSRVAMGWTNKRIAKDLDISAATVKTLLERMYRRSGCGNRAALVAWTGRFS